MEPESFHPSKRKIIFQSIIFRFYVNLPGCTVDVFFLLAVMKGLWCMPFVTPCWWLSCWWFFWGFQGFLGQTLWKVIRKWLKCHLKVHQKLARKRGRQLRLEKELKNSWPRLGHWVADVGVGWVGFLLQNNSHFNISILSVLSQKIQVIFVAWFPVRQVRKALHLSTKIHPTSIPNWLEAILVPSQPTQYSNIPYESMGIQGSLLGPVEFEISRRLLVNCLNHCHSAFLPRCKYVALK